MSGPAVELTPVVADPRWLSGHAKSRREMYALIDGHLEEGDRRTVLKHIEDCRKAGQIVAFTLASFPESERPSLAYVADHHKLSRHAMDSMRDTVLGMCGSASVQVTPRLFLPEKASRQARSHFSRWANKRNEDIAPDAHTFSCLYKGAPSPMTGSELCKNLGQWIMHMVGPWLPEGDAEEAGRHLAALCMSQRLRLPNLQVNYWCEGWPPKETENPNLVALTMGAEVVLPKMRRHLDFVIKAGAVINNDFLRRQPDEDADSFAELAVSTVLLIAMQFGHVNPASIEREVGDAFSAAMEGSAMYGAYQGLRRAETVAVDGSLHGGALLANISKAQALGISAQEGHTNNDAAGRAERNETALKEANSRHVDAMRALRAQQARRESALRARIERLEGSLQDATRPASQDTGPAAGETAERIASLEAHVRQISHQLDRVRGRRDQLSAMAQAMRAERDDYRSELWQYHQQDRVDDTNEALAADDPLAAARALGRLDRLGEWAASQLGPEIMLTRRALHAAEKSVHDDPALIARCLLAMKAWYAPMIFRSDEAARKAWRAFLTREHLEDGSTGKAVENKRTASSYTLTYGGCELRMDRHIQGSSSRDATRTLRIYFAIDKAHDRVVVGYLPGHLPNTLS